VPRVVGGVKCVIVNAALRDLEPMALDFVMNFARDNQLHASEIAPGEDLP
jgi:DNA-binding protein Fis